MFIKLSKYNLFLVSLLIIILIINSKPVGYLLGENGFLEIMQTLLLTLCLFVNFKHKKSLGKTYGVQIVNVKILFFFFLIYEELSILTTDMFKFLGSINQQSEFNLHNAIFLTKPLGNFDLLNNDAINLIPLTIFTLGTLLIIGFGSYIQFFKRFSYFFLEKRFSFYVLIYPFNFLLSYLLRPFMNLQNGFVMDQEFIELFLYLLLFLDNNIKVQISKL